MPKAKRAPNQRTVTITAPKALVKEIDRLSKEDKRNRSNWIVKELEEAVERHAARKKLGPVRSLHAGAAAEDSSPSTPESLAAEDPPAYAPPVRG